MIQVRIVDTNDVFVINEATLAYYKVGVHKVIEEDGMKMEVFYVEFCFNGERRLKFGVDAGLYDSKESLELQLLECTRSFGGQILVGAIL